MHHEITKEELAREIAEQEQIALRLQESLARLGDTLVPLPASLVRRLEEALEPKPVFGAVNVAALRG